MTDLVNYFSFYLFIYFLFFLQYEKAAAILSKHDPPVVLAKVDASEESNKALAAKYDVKGYPNLIIFRNEGKNLQDYKGPRDAEGIVSYLKKQAGPPSAEVKSPDDLENLFNNKKVYIVSYPFSHLI